MVTRMLVLVGVAAVALTACTAAGDNSAGDDAAEEAGTESAPAEEAATESAAQDRAAVSDAVTVVGHGEARGRPDVVRATVGVEVTADSAERALETASARASEVIDAVQDAGVAEEDIQTREISVREERERPPPPERDAEEPSEEPREEAAIIATNLLEVRIRDVDGAGAVLGAVSDAGGDATRIREVRFEVSETGPLLEAARERAFEDARRRAEQYAQLADRELGELVSIREAGSAPGPSAPPRSEEADAADVPVEPGTQGLTVQLTAVWSLD